VVIACKQSLPQIHDVLEEKGDPKDGGRQHQLTRTAQIVFVVRVEVIGEGTAFKGLEAAGGETAV